MKQAGGRRPSTPARWHLQQSAAGPSKKPWYGDIITIGERNPTSLYYTFTGGGESGFLFSIEVGEPGFLSQGSVNQDLFSKGSVNQDFFSKGSVNQVFFSQRLINQDLFFPEIGEPRFSHIQSSRISFPKRVVNQSLFFTGVGETKAFSQGGAVNLAKSMPLEGRKPGPVSSNGETPGSLFHRISFPKSWRSRICFSQGPENQAFCSLQDEEPGSVASRCQEPRFIFSRGRWTLGTVFQGF